MVVLDVCAACQIVAGTTKGKALLSFIGNKERVIVPSHFDVELLNALSKYVRGSKLSYNEVLSRFELIQEMITAHVNIADLSEEVLAESIRLKHDAYDMFYFILARRHNAVLLTVDKRLANLCADNRVSCVHFIETPAD